VNVLDEIHTFTGTVYVKKKVCDNAIESI